MSGGGPRGGFGSIIEGLGGAMGNTIGSAAVTMTVSTCPHDIVYGKFCGSCAQSWTFIPGSYTTMAITPGTVPVTQTRIIILTQEDIKEAISDWVSKVFKDGFLAGEVHCGEVRVELMFPEEALRK